MVEPPEYSDELYALQVSRLREQLVRITRGSDYYRRLFESQSLEPGEIRSLADYATWPILNDKTRDRENEVDSAMAEGHPFGTHLTVDPEEVVGIGTSSGTTGTPTFSHLYTSADLGLNEAIWARSLAWMGVPKGAVVINAFGLSMWAVGSIAVSALMNIGMRTAAVGAEGGPKRLLTVANAVHPYLLMCTPSMALRLIELYPKELGTGVSSLGVRAVYLSGEAGGASEQVRAHLAAEFATEAIFDGMVGGFGVAKVSCNGAGHWGLHHLTEDYFLHELYGPDEERGMELVDGAIGRVVYTSLLHQARPAIKYMTGDLARVERTPCPGCGLTFNRFSILGRTDDMLIIRGVNLFPEAIQDIVQQFVPLLTGQMKLIVAQGDSVLNEVPILEIESNASPESEEVRAACTEIETRVRDTLRVRVMTRPVPGGTLASEGRKGRLVERVGNRRVEESRR
jgi:phenylacetate-CoA ligase